MKYLVVFYTFALIILAPISEAKEIRLRCDFLTNIVEHDGSRRAMRSLATIAIKEKSEVREIILNSNIDGLEFHLHSSPDHFRNRNGVTVDETDGRAWKMHQLMQWREGGGLYVLKTKIEIDRNILLVLGELSVTALGRSTNSYNFSGDCKEIINRK
jgi:hypothetical protein